MQSLSFPLHFGFKLQVAASELSFDSSFFGGEEASDVWLSGVVTPLGLDRRLGASSVDQVRLYGGSGGPFIRT